MTRLIASAALVAVVLGWGAAGRASAVGETTEKLLKEAKLDYTKVKDGVYKVVLETKKGVAVIIVEEKEAGKDSKGNPILYAWLYTEVIRTPADFKPTAAMLTKLGEVNDNVRWGSVGLSKNKDNSYSLFRNAHVFLKNLEAEQLEDYVFIVHGDKFALNKVFAGFVDG